MDSNFNVVFALSTFWGEIGAGNVFYGGNLIGIIFASGVQMYETQELEGHQSIIWSLGTALILHIT